MNPSNALAENNEEQQSKASSHHLVSTLEGEEEVDRSHMLDTIVRALSEQTPVVFLEGESGCGATTSLRQLAKRYPKNTFLLEVTAASRVSYGIEYLKHQLAEQIAEVLGIAPPDIEKSISADWVQWSIKLRRHATRQVLYVAVDGLHQIPDDEAGVVAEIFREVLPIGIKNCRLIITGQQEKFRRYLVNVQSKTYEQLRFSIGEAKQFLGKAVTRDEDLAVVFRICDGLPSKLAIVKRLVASGIAIEEVLSAESGAAHEIIKLEFRALSGLSGAPRLAIAVLAVARQHLTIERLAGILDSTPSCLEPELKKCSFITLDENERFQFVSELHRKYAEKALSDLRGEALRLHISYFLRHPNTSSAVRFLPALMEQAGDDEALMAQLSPEHYLGLLNDTSSTIELLSHAQLGARRAYSLKRFAESLKFSFQRSLFRALAEDGGLSSEIGALVSLGQSNRALALASQAASLESRLALLARYAKEVKQAGNIVEEPILAYLREIASQIDLGELSDRALDVAADLVFVDANLAFAIVEQAAKHGTSAHLRDIALARMSIALSIDTASEHRREEEEVRKRIKDEHLSDMIATVVCTLAEASTARVKEVAERLEPRRRIPFLRGLVNYKPARDGALDIVEYALDSMVKDSLYRPSSGDLAALARPLVMATSENERVAGLVKRLESQIGLIEDKSPTRDLVVLRMRLARAEYKVDPELGAERILAVYYDVAAIANSEARAEGLAQMLRFISNLDDRGVLEQKHQIRSVLKADLASAIEDILSNTADHFEIVRGALGALATFDADEALRVAGGLNSEERRDDAFRHIAITLFGRKHSASAEASVRASLERIQAPNRHDESRHACIRALRGNLHRKLWLPFATRLVEEIHDAARTCDAEFDLVEVFHLASCEADLERLKTRLDTLIERHDSSLDAANTYFRAARVFAKREQGEAERYYDRGVSERATSGFYSEEAVNILATSLLLIVRAFIPLVRQGLNSEEHVRRIQNLVEAVPCARTRALIYGDLAIRSWASRRLDLCKKIVSTCCIPLTDLDERCSPKTRPILIELFPALFLAQPATALRLLEGVHRIDRDAVLIGAVRVILLRAPLREPINSRDYQKYEPGLDDIDSVLQLLEKIEGDSSFYVAVELVSTALACEAMKNRVSQPMRADIVARIRKLISLKLPDKRNIQHDGYVTVCLAHTGRIVKQQDGFWDGLVAKAARIPNASDKAYVRNDIARCLPVKLRDLKKKLLLEVLADIEGLPSAFDRSMRYEVAATVASSEVSELVPQTVRSAVAISPRILDKARSRNHLREIVEIADRYKSGFGNTLLEMLDDDPARHQAKSELSRQLEINKAKHAMASKPSSLPDAQARAHFSEAAWRNFEAFVNGRIIHKPLEEMTLLLQQGSDLDVHGIFPILSWYVENARQRHSTIGDTTKYVVPIFEALLVSGEIAASMIAAHGKRKDKPFTDFERKDSIVCKPSTRAEALEFIGRWLRDSSAQTLKVCDPYFSPTDAEVLQLILAEAPGAVVRVLCSRAELKRRGALSSDAFRFEWDKRCDQDMPDTEIIAAGRESDDRMPIHDRWMISESGGLRLGTSLGSVGEARISEISVMDAESVAAVEDSLEPYFQRRRVVDGDRIGYATFTL